MVSIIVIKEIKIKGIPLRAKYTYEWHVTKFQLA